MANKKRLIVADALETRMGNLCDEFGTDHLFIDAIIYEIGTAPTVDAAPVVHGWWMIAGRGIRACSECNHGIREHMACVNHYCPNCGAKMDGGSDNE